MVWCVVKNTYTRAVLLAVALILLAVTSAQPPELSEHETYYEAQHE